MDSIHTVQQKLTQDPTLQQRTNMSIQNIVTLLEFCLKNIYFLFQGKYYEQVQGIAMGSPISPFIADLFMEEFEVKALNTFPKPPSLWQRFVDDTFAINKPEHSQKLLQHINNQDQHIQFTVEEPSQEGTLPILDTLVIIGPNNTFSTTVYRKPIHTDQYLHWDSNHFITAKHSVYNTLAHRAKIVSSNQEAMNKDLNHIKRALQACQFPLWALNQLQQKFESNHNYNQDSNHTNNPINIDSNNSTNNNSTNNQPTNNRNITIVENYNNSLEHSMTEKGEVPPVGVKLDASHLLDECPNH